MAVEQVRTTQVCETIVYNSTSPYQRSLLHVLHMTHLQPWPAGRLALCATGSMHSSVQAESCHRASSAAAVAQAQAAAISRRQLRCCMHACKHGSWQQ